MGSVWAGGGVSVPHPNPLCLHCPHSGLHQLRHPHPQRGRAQKWGEEAAKGGGHISGEACTKGGWVSVGLAKEMVRGSKPHCVPSHLPSEGGG